MNRFSLSIVGFAITALAAVACAPSAAESDDQGTSGDEPEIVTAKGACSKAAYDAAFVHYKAAVDRSKARNAGDVCGGENYLGTIADEAGTAVATCGEFQTVIATSKWAAPLRKALEGNLALAELTGALEVKDASGKATWKGLSGALDGVTMFGPAPGATGHFSLMTFGKGNAVTVQIQVYDDAKGIRYEAHEGTYALGAVGSDGRIAVSVTVEGKKVAYALGDASGDAHTPSYVLEPTEKADYEAGDLPSLLKSTYGSLPDECSA